MMTGARFPATPGRATRCGASGSSPPSAARAFRHERPTQLDRQHEEPQEYGTVRVDPEQAQHREGAAANGGSPTPWSGATTRAGTAPGRSRALGRPPQCRRLPQASRRMMTATRPPTCPEGPGVGRRRDETQPPEDDGVEAVGHVPEGAEQCGEGELGAPLVGHPAPMRLCVAERIEAHEGVVGPRPLSDAE